MRNNSQIIVNAFKINGYIKLNNRIFRARLVACGYSQVPGTNFNDGFAPVLNDVSFRIMLIAKLFVILPVLWSILRQHSSTRVNNWKSRWRCLKF
jgi:hypothetical protein